MRILILALALALCSFAVEADPVILGPGQASMSMPVGRCNFDTNPACNYYFDVTSISGFVTNIRSNLSIGLFSWNTMLAPGQLQTFHVPLDGSTSAEIFNSTTITTVAAVPEPASIVLLLSGIGALALRRRRS